MARRGARTGLAAFRASGDDGALLERVLGEESEFNEIICFGRIRELAGGHGLA
ncbi:MAG: hypothetical protein HYV93_19995 [Candidatus Rokubacteria bacterium]|nr:hypothetical protein [Candidatus Rokubacteria bacterium]